MIFRYSYRLIQHSDGTSSRVPLVPVRLIGKETIETNGVVDSGSDSCAISLATAQILGLPLSGKKERTYGVGGFVDSVEAMVKLVIKQERKECILNIPIRIILNQDDFPLLLGQEDFFDKFIIKFNKRKGTFSLKKVGTLF